MNYNKNDNIHTLAKNKVSYEYRSKSPTQKIVQSRLKNMIQQKE